MRGSSNSGRVPRDVERSVAGGGSPETLPSSCLNRWIERCRQDFRGAVPVEGHLRPQDDVERCIFAGTGRDFNRRGWGDQELAPEAVATVGIVAGSVITLLDDMNNGITKRLQCAL